MSKSSEFAFRTCYFNRVRRQCIDSILHLLGIILSIHLNNIIELIRLLWLGGNIKTWLRNLILIGWYHILKLRLISIGGIVVFLGILWGIKWLVELLVLRHFWVKMIIVGVWIHFIKFIKN